MMGRRREHSDPATLAGVVVALGIIYGDIGTSPLYVLKAIVGDHAIDRETVHGALSLIFWTLTLQTTLKYILLILQADNNGEGGIFSLYALVRRRAKWLLVPAILGGAALLADGLITPPISVSSAVEGLRIISPNIPTVPIVIGILIGLFSVQHFGTKKVGVSFGPAMVLWFSMLAILGLIQIMQEPSVLWAINPLDGIALLTHREHGFLLLGAVFLCTTGAEALYSDLGHCGKSNIRVSWGFVKIALLLNYFGQGAWLMAQHGGILDGRNPFYEMMPRWFLPIGIMVATTAAVIASQALISGSYTIVTEAMRLSLFPKAKVVYPTELKGQIYVPFVNLFMLFGCIGVVLFFKESSEMEAAYGLAITITMLMTTILFTHYLIAKRVSPPLVWGFFGLYAILEAAFLLANLTKFHHGGYVTVVIGGVFFLIMWVWSTASKLKRDYTEYVSLDDHLDHLTDLSGDDGISKYATHLVYMTGAPVPELIESKIIYSIFRKSPKRADVYWFIHVNVLDVPYLTEYEVTTLVPEKVFRIDFNLGFRVEPRINLFFRRVIEELAESGEVDILSRYESLRKANIPGDFRFVVLEKSLSYENALPPFEQFIMETYFVLKGFSLSEERSFGLDTSSVTTEKVPLVIAPMKHFELTRAEE